MKLQIDTVAKTIKLEQSAKITQIIAMVKKLLPNDWKEYHLEAVQTIYNWYNPVYIPSVWTPQPYIPFTYTTNAGTDETIFNVCSTN